jgi:hypothetical protein
MYERACCEICGTKNLVDLGDFNDCTVVDVEAVKCYKCGEVFLMGDEYQQMDELREIILCHFDSEEIGKTAEQLVDELMKDKKKLSDFLREHAYIETGVDSIRA